MLVADSILYRNILAIYMEVLSQCSPISLSVIQGPWWDRRLWTKLQSSGEKEKKKEKKKETTCAPFCALAAKNKLDIEKERKAQGYWLTKPRWGGRRWGAVDGAGGEEQASGRSYVRGRLYGLYSRVLHPSGFKSDGATGTPSLCVRAQRRITSVF